MIGKLASVAVFTGAFIALMGTGGTQHVEIRHERLQPIAPTTSLTVPPDPTVIPPAGPFPTPAGPVDPPELNGDTPAPPPWNQDCYWGDECYPPGGWPPPNDYYRPPTAPAQAHPKLAHPGVMRV